jgi:hypothetical protein
MVVGLLLVGCSESALVGGTYMEDDPPAGTCEDTDAAECETGGQGDDCASSAECGGNLVCGATFDGDIGRFQCQAACVPTMDESRWCIDDAACCDTTASCGPRGYCMISEDVDTGVDTGTGTGTSGDASTGAGSTDTGTGTESGSSSDTATGTDTGTSTGVTGA